MRGAYPTRSVRRCVRIFQALLLLAICAAMATPSVAKPNKRSRAAYKNGVEHFKRKSYGRAIESFERAYR